MLFLPVCSPDFNPIELAFAKLKQHLRGAAARTFLALAPLQVRPSRPSPQPMRAASSPTVATTCPVNS